jgi:ParB family transcriptional regulator, chromosome partitioning protein
LGALLGGTAAAGTSPASATALATHLDAPAATDARDRVQRVALSRIRPSPFQPRKDFTDGALRELADSIREQGVVQPLIVRAKADHFELIAGERRWRAAQIAGLTEVPVIVREAADTEALELALIENLQRENLNPIEEALGYRQLIEQFQLRQEDAAQKVGKSRVVVANALRLLRLPDELQAYIRNGQLSVGHAKVILGLAGPDEQKLAAERVIRDGLNVRQTEELISRLQAGTAIPDAGRATARSGTPKDVHVAALETRIQERLGTKVTMRYRQGRGAIEIRFFSDADLDRLLGMWGVRSD